MVGRAGVYSHHDLCMPRGLGKMKETETQDAVIGVIDAGGDWAELERRDVVPWWCLEEEEKKAVSKMVPCVVHW